MTVGEVCVQKGAAQKPGELDLLAPLLPQPLGTVVEIGSAEGGTAWFWHLCDAERIVCVDRAPNIDKNLYPPRVETFFYADSHSNNTRALLFGAVQACDVLFIDGDHSFEGVRADYTDYRGLVRPGGLICFHDICYHPNVPECRVDLLWWMLKESGADCAELVCEPASWGGIGVVKVPENPGWDGLERS